MILEIVGILLLVALLAIAINNIERVNKKNNSKISFKESMDLTELPVVTFYNGDNKLNFLLDTGSNFSHINSSIITLLEHTKTDKKTDLIGMEGNKVSSSICNMSISYKNQKFEEEFIISDLNGAFNIIKQEDGVQIHGILGSRFFEKYKYVLDFNELIAYIK